MKNAMHMEIAGVHFTVRCQYPLLVDKLPETYRQFLMDTVSPGADIHVNVLIETGTMPDTGRMTNIFDGGESWSMWQNSDSYFVTLHSPALDGKLLWAAKFNSSAKKVTVYPGDILTDRNSEGVGIFNPFSYPLDQILLMYFLEKKEGALFHAAGININGKGYIFPGKSGAGKTTLSRQFVAKNYSGLLSDDRIVIRKIDNRFMAFGTPWPGEAGIAVNKSVNLSGIFFITQANSNRIEEIKPQKALERLLPVVSIPWYDKEVMIRILDFCEDVISNIPAYELFFKPDTEVADFLDKFDAS